MSVARLKTSVTLPESLLAELDREFGKGANRSQLIEMAVVVYLDQIRREKRDKRDFELINRHADELNREAMDALSYQTPLWRAAEPSIEIAGAATKAKRSKSKRP